MKTTLKQLGLFVALAFTVNASYAFTNPTVEMKALQGKSAVLNIDDAKDAHIEIMIQNKAGEVVFYSETSTAEEKFQHVYDFSEYKPGVYDMIVTNDNVVTEHQFTVEGEMVAVGDKQMTQTPFFAFDGDDAILRVAYLNYPGEKLKLKVYEGNELIYNKALDNSFSVNEGLNLSKLQAGHYQIVLAAGTKKFNYPVIIR